MPTAVASSSPDGAAGSTGTAAALPRRRQRYALLLANSLVLLFVQGVAAPSEGQRVVVTALAATSLLLALRAAGVKRPLRELAAVLCVLVIAFSVVSVVTSGVGEGVTRLMNAALVGLGPPVIALGIVRDLRVTGQVRVEALAGVLSLYLLLGMLFAFLYGAIDQLGSAPFFAGGNTATVAHCVYFSFTTLTTVGYGDYVAQSNLGHTLAIFEALIGQIYLVTVVSLIVTNIRRPLQADRSTTPEVRP